MADVIITIGPPGAGKSSWGTDFSTKHGYVYLSSDSNRNTLGTGEDDQTVSARAFELLRTQLKEALNKNQNVILDACFVSKKSRRDFIILAKTKGATVTAKVFMENRKTLLERNYKRGQQGGRNVPAFVIDRMLKNYQAPTLDEFDKIM